MDLHIKKDQDVHLPNIMLTGRAETPSVMDIRTSNKRPPIRIVHATQSGLKQPCFRDEATTQ